MQQVEDPITLNKIDMHKGKVWVSWLRFQGSLHCIVFFVLSRVYRGRGEWFRINVKRFASLQSALAQSLKKMHHNKYGIEVSCMRFRKLATVFSRCLNYVLQNRVETHKVVSYGIRTKQNKVNKQAHKEKQNKTKNNSLLTVYILLWVLNKLWTGSWWKKMLKPNKRLIVIHYHDSYYAELNQLH